MPLSEEEQRLLRQLEQSLAADDPEFASTLRGSKFVARNRRIFGLAILGCLVGLAVVFVSALTAQTIVGVLGFVLMVVSGYFAVSSWQRGVTGDDEDEEPRRVNPSHGPGNQSVIDRMEERWNRRRDSDGF